MSQIQTKPLLPLRDIVIFPSMVVPLFVGREKSIKALQEVMKSDKSIVLVAQKNSEVDEPENKDLYGTIKPTEISKIINQSDKIDIKPSLIQPLNEIKSLGTFKVKINLHSEVQAEIKIKVISEDNIK